MKGKILKSFIACMSLALGFIVFNPMPASAAWKQDSYGWWNTEGHSWSIGWRQIDGKWYYFGSDGYMKTGWTNDNGTWYYLSNSGAMNTGWINDNGTWYHLGSSGAMNTGWINDNGTWYYTNESGTMQTGLITLNNHTYYLNESGAMVTGDITINGVKYTFGQNGEKVSSSNITADSNVANTGNTVTEETAKDETVSSGGGGGGSTAGSIENYNFASYSDLYGKWTINSYISNSGMEASISQENIDFIVGENITLDKNIIYHALYSVKDVKTSEDVLTDSQFNSKFGTSLSKLGIKGDKVNCITVSAVDNSNNRRTGYLLTTKDNKVFAITKGAAFELTK